MTSPPRVLLTMSVSALLSLAAPPAALAQDGAAGLRVGVALSGGSAKGFAHIGVLRVLEEAGLRIDIVTGTSMGSVMGALYAIGMPVDSMEALVRSVDWNNVLGDGSARARRFLHQRRFDDRAIATLPVEGGNVALPAGAIVGSNIVRLAEVAMWRAATVRSFDALPRSFAAVATDIVTGEAVRLTKGTLPDAVRASAGIPGAFEPLLLDGLLLVDGGLSRNLPASDARELGADFVICSDVSTPLSRLDQLGTFVDVLNQVNNLSMLQSTEVERSYCDILIRTDVEGLSSLAFDRADEWIERGTAAARDHLGELEDLAARPGPPPAPVAPFRPLPDSVRVVSIEVEGADRLETEELVRQELRLRRGSYISPAVLSDRLSNLDATGLFGLVRSRIDAAPGGVALTIRVQERRNDRFGVGIRYDDTRLAALLFNLTLHNRIRYGSVTRFDLRVGEETRARVAYLRREGVTGRFEGGVSLGWSKSELRPPEQAPSDIELTTLSGFLGISGRRTTFIGLEATAERALTDAAALADVRLVSGALVADHESLDRYDFPRRGSDGSLKWELGVTDLVEGGNFSVFVASARSYVPLLPRLTLDLGMFFGHGGGQDLPLRRTFFVGGVHPSTVFPDSKPTFHGLAEQELNGRHAQIARAGLRFQAREGAYVRVGLDAGGVSNRWRLPVAERIYGWGLTLGLTSVIGPVLLEWGKASNGSGVRLSLGVGRRF